MTETTTFGLRKELTLSFDEALVKVREALRGEGFGVLTEIDIQGTLHEKLGVDFRRYQILGACNPPLAHRALTAELEIGLMLPCNVVVYEDDAGHAVVAAIDPEKTLAGVGNPALVELAKAVRDKLARVLEALP